MRKHRQFVGSRQFRRIVEAGSGTVPAVRMGFEAEVKQTDPENDRVLQFTISTGGIDRDQDRIDVRGWHLSEYRKNPVVLFGHHYWNSEAPVVGTSLTEWIQGDKLRSLMEFTPKGLIPLADMLHALYTTRASNGQAYMRATSVGFLPKEWEFTKDEDRPWGIDFKEQELLEYSLVPVPANAGALQEALKSGIDTAPLHLWTEQVLDEWEKDHKEQNFWLPKSMLRNILSDTKHKKSVTVPPEKREVETKNILLQTSLEAGEDRRPHFHRFELDIDDDGNIKEQAITTEPGGMDEHTHTAEIPKTESGQMIQVVTSEDDGHKHTIEFMVPAALGPMGKEKPVVPPAKKQLGDNVQSIIFSKETSPSDVNDGKGWTEAASRAWVGEHEGHTEKVDETENSFRFRQFEPSECEEGSFVTLSEDLPTGIQLLVCTRKSFTPLTQEEVLRLRGILAQKDDDPEGDDPDDGGGEEVVFTIEEEEVVEGDDGQAVIILDDDDGGTDGSADLTASLREVAREVVSDQIRAAIEVINKEEKES